MVQHFLKHLIPTCYVCLIVNNNNPLLCVQVEGIKEIGDFITKSKRAGDGLGTHILDKELAA